MYRSAMPDDDGAVRYLDGGGKATVYRGGSRSWRTHNPGEVGHGMIAINHGAIGKLASLAVFPSEDKGRACLDAVLADHSFSNLTVIQAYQRFGPHYEPEQPEQEAGAGPDEPPPPPVCPYTGIQADRLMTTLSADERDQMATAIRDELIGWQEGEIEEEDLAESESKTSAAAPQGQNVLINGRSAVHAGSQGVLITPDVCKTPSGDGCKPVLYTNVARSADADFTAATVKINGYPACIESSIFSKSTGDEAGSCGGVASGTVKSIAHFIKGSGNVTIEGEPAVRQFDLMTSNNRNTPPMPLMQGGGPIPPELEAGDLDALEASQGPNAVRVDLLGRDFHWLPGNIDARSAPGQSRRAPLPTGARRTATEALVITGLPSGAEPALSLDLQGERERLAIPLADAVPSVAYDPEGDPEVSEQAGQYELTPVRFHRRNPGDDADHAPVRGGGFIYIFRDGELVRELTVMDSGDVYREIDVADRKRKGRALSDDIRSAAAPRTSVATSHVLLASKIAGQSITYEVAYSEIAWSNERIAQLERDGEERRRRCALWPAEPGSGEALASVQPDRPDGDQVIDQEGDRVIVLTDALAEARTASQAAQALGDQRALTAVGRDTGEYALARLIRHLLEAEGGADAHEPGDAGNAAQDSRQRDGGAQRGPDRAQAPTTRTGLFDTPPERHYEDSLADNVDRERLDERLDAWQRYDEALAQAEADIAATLVNVLDSTRFWTAFRDYIDSGQRLLRWLGAVHWALLVEPVSTAALHRLHRRALAGEIPELAWLAEPDAALRDDLLGVARAGRALDADRPVFAALSPAERSDAAARGGLALEALLDKLGEAIQHEGISEQEAAERLARLYTAHTQITFEVRTWPALRILELMLRSEPARYVDTQPIVRQMPQSLRNTRIVQAVARQDAGIPRSPGDLPQTTLAQRGLYRVLGPLLAANAALAMRAFAQRQGLDTFLNMVGAFGSLASFYGQLLKEVFERQQQIVAQRLHDVATSQSIPGGLATPSSLHGGDQVRAAFAGRAEVLERQARLLEERKTTLAGRIQSAKWFYTIGNVVGAAADVGLGGYYMGTGISGGNTEVAVGGGLIGMAGGLGLWAAALSFLGTGGPVGLLAVSGLALSLLGTAVVIGHRDSALARALRASPLGTHPGFFGYHGFELPEPEPHTDRTLGSGAEIDLADYQPVLAEIHRALFGFEQQLQVLRHVPDGGYVVHGRIRFARLVPGRSAVDVGLTLGATAPPGGDDRDRVRHLTTADPELVLCEQRDGDGYLTALEVVTRVNDLPAIQRGVALATRVDIDGTGTFTVPRDGEPAVTTWHFNPRVAEPFDGPMTRHTYERVYFGGAVDVGERAREAQAWLDAAADDDAHEGES